MKKNLPLKLLAVVLAVCLLVMTVPMQSFAEESIAASTETFVAEAINRDGIDTVDTAKSNYFNKYWVAGKSTKFGTYGHVPNVIKFGGAGVAANGTQTFLFDLNDATISFTPYIATFSFLGKLSVYGSKDGEIWLPLILNENPGQYTYKGNSTQWNPDSDVTDIGTLSAWSNYNIANMNALLTDNAEKKIYLKFNYIGDGTNDTEVNAKAFGITASYDSNAVINATSGVENYISDANNRSGAGEYLSTGTHSEDATKETYLNKYMVTDQTNYRGLYNVVEFNASVSSNNKITFRYDLNDNTVSFVPAVWVNTNTNANIKIEASKDGSTWYEIVNEDVTGDGVTNGLIYGDTANVPYVDDVAQNYCTSKAWTSLNTENIKTILSSNYNKIVYIRFSRVAAPATGNEISEYRGFGLTSVYDETEGCETIVAEVGNRSGVSAADSSKTNYFNNY